MGARLTLLGFALLFLAGCATRQPAPVVERSPLPIPAPQAEVVPPPAPPVARPVPTHTVKRGETLYGIALQYGLDYRELAAWNGITNFAVVATGRVLVVGIPDGSAPGMPGSPAIVATPLAQAGPPIEARPLANSTALKVEPRGQKLPYSDRALAQLAGPEAGGPPVPGSTPAVTPPPAATAPAPPEVDRTPGTDREDVDWMWPVKGKTLSGFSEASRGLDIAGRKGESVRAAAAGKVIYAGDAVRGYGKLIIIKHNETWISAYAHNDALVVKELQDVKKGQKIAEMGSTDADQVKLHFEVRRLGKPVDPLKVLPAP